MATVSHMTAAFFVAVACYPLAASARPAGRLAGMVRDVSGAVLPRVAVTITGQSLVAPRIVITDDHGRYDIDQLLQLAVVEPLMVRRRASIFKGEREPIGGIAVAKYTAFNFN